jgi:hypothetical protein
MNLRKLLINSSFLFFVLLVGCQTKDNNKFNEEPLVHNQITPAELTNSNMECETGLDCREVKDPNDGCCGWSYAINNTGYEIYQKTFEKEFRELREMCEKEYSKGLSCSLQLFEPVCIDKMCKLKDKMDGDKIIDNAFYR